MDDDNNDSGRYQYDAFISYRRVNPDRKFARELCHRLESAGLKVAIDERDFDPAAKFLNEMERCVRESRFMLAVLSPRYFAGGYAEEEAVISHVMNIGERQRRLIPLVIEEVVRPVWLFGIVGIDFTDEDPMIDPYERLRDTLGKAIKVKRDSDEPVPVKPVQAPPKPKKPQLPSVQNIHGWPEHKVQALQRETAEAKNLSVVFRDRFTDGSEGSEMVVIPAGQFLMGSPEDEKDRRDNEQQHEVKLVRPFALGKYAVTFAEYDRFVKETGREKPDDENWGRGNRPVINVSWNNAVAYAEWLSVQTGETYCLPTEAEWEYAARAGSSAAYCFRDDPRRLGEYAWYDSNSDGRTHPVGEKKPNAWGLYDVHGNVWEWVADWYDEDYYSNSPVENPGGPNTGSFRVFRGGGWVGVAGYCRSAIRVGREPGNRYDALGFRLSRLL